MRENQALYTKTVSDALAMYVVTLLPGWVSLGMSSFTVEDSFETPSELTMEAATSCSKW